MGYVYHYFCYLVLGIMYQVKPVEDKDRKKELSKPEYKQKWKTRGLLLHLYKSLFGTGKVVIESFQSQVDNLSTECDTRNYFEGCLGEFSTTDVFARHFVPEKDANMVSKGSLIYLRHETH